MCVIVLKSYDRLSRKKPYEVSLGQYCGIGAGLGPFQEIGSATDTQFRHHSAPAHRSFREDLSYDDFHGSVLFFQAAAL